MLNAISNTNILFTESSSKYKDILSKFLSYDGGLWDPKMEAPWKSSPIYDVLDYQKNGNSTLSEFPSLSNLENEEFTVMSISSFEVDPGVTVAFHIDPHDVKSGFKRLHLALQCDPLSGLIVDNGEVYTWEEGKWMDFSGILEMHSPINNGVIKTIIIILDLFEGTPSIDTIRQYYREIFSQHNMEFNI